MNDSANSIWLHIVEALSWAIIIWHLRLAHRLRQAPEQHGQYVQACRPVVMLTLILSAVSFGAGVFRWLSGHDATNAFIGYIVLFIVWLSTLCFSTYIQKEGRSHERLTSHSA